jgi:hypothetical protein
VIRDITIDVYEIEFEQQWICYADDFARYTKENNIVLYAKPQQTLVHKRLTSKTYMGRFRRVEFRLRRSPKIGELVKLACRRLQAKLITERNR